MRKMQIVVGRLRKCGAAAFAGATLLAALGAQAAIQIGTGLDASGNPLSAGSTEGNYTVAGSGASSAIVYYLGYAWVPNVANGQWIAPVDNNGNLDTAGGVRPGIPGSQPSLPTVVRSTAPELFQDSFPVTIPANSLSTDTWWRPARVGPSPMPLTGGIGLRSPLVSSLGSTTSSSKSIIWAAPRG